MKKKHLILTASVMIAAWLAAFGDKTPENDSALAIPYAAAEPPADAATVNPNSLILTLTPRASLIGGARRHIQPVALFASHSWTPAPPPVKAAPPPAPAAPPLPFNYLGKQKEGAQWTVFLGRNDSTWLVKKNDLIDNQYQVVDISPPAIILLYLPLKQIQSLTIE